MQIRIKLKRDPHQSETTHPDQIDVKKSHSDPHRSFKKVRSGSVMKEKPDPDPQRNSDSEVGFGFASKGCELPNTDTSTVCFCVKFIHKILCKETIYENYTDNLQGKL